ncbi:MAG: sulfotransferase [Cyanobacteria bacterium SZAS LIN-5]|nr:sulfotransferase [Cyanobacteria bacterium SZAS LIN-5]
MHSIEQFLEEKKRRLEEPTMRELELLNERYRSINLAPVEEPAIPLDFNARSIFLAIKSGISRRAEATRIPRLSTSVLQKSYFGISQSRRRKLFSPIFVVGSGHSGTSIMLKILSNHSHIYAVEGESDCFIWLGLLSKLRRFISWNKLTLKTGAERWAEKTPKHLWYLKDIFNYYPDAKVIVMLRDGRDVALSQSKTWGCFEQAVKRWAEEYRVAEQYLDNPNVMMVKYEDLVTNSTRTLADLFDFSGEEFEPEIVHTELRPERWYSDNLEKPDIISSATHQQYRNWQINQPLTDFSKKWITQMSDEQKVIFKNLAGSLLIELGYADDLNW